MSDAGWFDDPSGRFGRRWYDGSAWSEHVVGANGTATTDALPDRGTPYPPPSAGVRAQPTPPPAQAWAGPPPAYGYGPPPGGAPIAPFGPPPRFGPGPGLVVGLVGVVCAALSLLGLKWVDVDRGSFLDLSSGLRDRDLPDGADAGDTIAYYYGAWAGFVLLVLVLIAVLAAGVPVPSTSASAQRVIGSLLAGLAAVLHTVTTSRFSDLEFGAYLGAVGYFVCIVGFVIGVRAKQLPVPPGFGAPPFTGVPR
ncbi:DUF2510 domain-containing protein [Jatrophihabitans fulvus]